MQFWKLYKIPLVLTCVSLFFYWLFIYDLVRTEYTKLITLYILLWFVFILLLKYGKDNIKFLTTIAFLFRMIFILAIPNLSQDFYRFIWDGRMVLEGLNPYLYTPESFIQNQEFPVAQAQELYSGMGQLNGSHFTNYPPINQLCFIIAGLFSGHSILGSAMVLRLLIIAADFGTLVFGKRLLKQLNIPVKNIFWYILNPFVIIELTGNLHFEGVMIFFLVCSLYLLHLGKWKWAAVIFALSISVKLIPLLFLPLLLFYFKKNTNNEIIKKVKTKLSFKDIDIKKLISFYFISGLTTLILFAPFYNSDFINNYTKTVGLWFQNFEFNASFYYVFREIGFWVSGYNEIAIIGKLMAITVFIIVITISLMKKNNSTHKLILSMLLALTSYYFLSTTVHPWYVTTLLFLSVFTTYKFPLVWSFMVVFSYLAYANSGTTENLWIVAFEYVVVFTVFLHDLKKTRTIEN